MPSDVRGGGDLGYGAGVGAGYEAPERTANTIRGSFMRMESSGVEFGLSAHSEFDPENPVFPQYNNARNPLNGNSRETPNPYYDSKYGVTEKGHSFDVF